MKLKLLDDLRFVIGVFFLFVTVLLVIAGNEPTPAGVELTGGSIGNLNLFSAGLMGSFAVLMLVATFLFPLQEGH